MALVGYALISFILLELFYVGPVRILAFGAGFVPTAVVCSTVPDLDHKDSIPRRIFGKLSLYLTPVVAAIIILFDHPIRDIFIETVADIVVSNTFAPVEYAVVTELVIANVLVGAIVLGTLHILDEMTHRAILHNPATAFALSSIAVCLIYIYWGDIIPWMMLGGIGLGSTYGYLTHLWLDEEL